VKGFAIGLKEVKGKSKLFRLQFHTGLVKRGVVEFSKNELDDINKDKKKFPSDFNLRLNFSDLDGRRESMAAYHFLFHQMKTSYTDAIAQRNRPLAATTPTTTRELPILTRTTSEWRSVNRIDPARHRGSVVGAHKALSFSDSLVGGGLKAHSYSEESTRLQGLYAESTRIQEIYGSREEKVSNLSRIQPSIFRHGQGPVRKFSVQLPIGQSKMGAGEIEIPKQDKEADGGNSV